MRRVIQQALKILLMGFCYTALAQGILKFNTQITGLQNAELKNALARLQIRQKPVKDHLTPNIIQKLFKHGPREIRKAIEPFGYFKPTITKKLTYRNNTWTATYFVNPGRRLHITTLNINITGPGKNNKQLQKLLTRLRKKTDKVFTTKLYNKISNTLLNRAQENGYLRANFTKNQTIINLQSYTCKINLTLDTGSRYYFGSVTFSPSPLANSFLRRYVDFTSKTPFSYNKLFNLQERLEGSDYFSSVAATAYQKNRKHIPVHVALKMNKNKAYKIGIGYGTNSGLRATAGFNWRWINRWGHKINLLARMSQAEHNLAAQYLIPGKHPAKEQYTINGGIYKLTPHNGVSYMQSIGVAYIRNYTRWQQTISLDYQHEHYRLVDGGQYYRAHMLVPTISFSHVTTNRIINVHRGNRFNITVRGASEKALSTVTFLQTEVQDKMIYTLWKANRIVLRGHFGYTAAKKAAQLPISKQFYTGGINSIRGFGYNYLGPGKYLITGSAEYQRRIYKQIYGAIFYDKGNALNRWKDPMVHSYGIGAVWQTQLGALQVYVARAKDISSNKHRYRLEFSLGPDL
jgi:translocation and assembly module TamA